MLNGDRFFYTHKEDGIKKERGLSKAERTQIQSRKLSDIMCDNMDIESINQDIFRSKSKLIECTARTKLSLNGPTKISSGKNPIYIKGRVKKTTTYGLVHIRVDG